MTSVRLCRRPEALIDKALEQELWDLEHDLLSISLNFCRLETCLVK